LEVIIMPSVKALSYLRVSSPGQVDGDGLERQRLAVAEFAETAGYQIVEEYRDDGVSGTCEWENRPGLSALLERLASNGVRVVIVEHVDRLARDLMVSELILAECRRVGARAMDVSGNDLADNKDSTRVLIRQVLSAVAQFDRSNIVLRMVAARDRIAERTGRRPEGRKPYGHYPGERAVIDRARALLATHVAGVRPHYATVAAELNTEGLPTRTGVPWSGAMVRRVLRRSKYL
jgi:DNA invertase Pin-like site-specific DNA recombinase